MKAERHGEKKMDIGSIITHATNNATDSVAEGSDIPETHPQGSRDENVHLERQTAKGITADVDDATSSSEEIDDPNDDTYVDDEDEADDSDEETDTNDSEATSYRHVKRTVRSKRVVSRQQNQHASVSTVSASSGTQRNKRIAFDEGNYESNIRVKRPPRLTREVMTRSQSKVHLDSVSGQRGKRPRRRYPGWMCSDEE